MQKTAIIAGSGAEGLVPFRDWEWVMVETRFGKLQVRQGEVDGRTVLFTERHGTDHSVAPHLINYPAIISALSQLGVEQVIATAAVGSLSKDMIPGTAAVITDFIDFARGEPITFFSGSESEVVHTDMSEPYCPEISRALLSGLEAAGLEVTTPCTYICTSGPRYETPAEIAMFRSWGGDVVGMTSAPEAILAREAGLCYGAVAIVTNLAAGISPSRLSHDEVVAMMKSLEGPLATALLEAIRRLPLDRGCSCAVRLG